MSPASYLAAPPRVAGRIVAHAGTIVGVWDWAVWATLAFAVLATLGAGALAAVRLVSGWRALTRARRQLAAHLGDLAARGEATTDKLAVAGDRHELGERLARLRGSLAQLTVLRGALADADDALGWLGVFAPWR